MNRVTYTGCLIAVAIGAYGGVAYAQQQRPQPEPQPQAQPEPQPQAQPEPQPQAQPEPQPQAQPEPQPQVQPEPQPQAQPEPQPQAQPEPQAQAPQPQPQEPTAEITESEASEMIGQSVKTRDGEEVGEISGVARSLADQRLHALVDVGGFLGIGERTVSIPLERAQLDDEGNVMTQMSRQEIEQMEEYDPAQYASVEEEDQRILR